MRKRMLGNTGMAVSELAFGGVEIGLPYGIGVKNEADMLNEQEAIRLLNNALQNGINFYDTARLYGESERIMGKAFKGKRDKVILASKCRHLKTEDGSIPDYKGLQQLIGQSLIQSLAALQTDYLDLYMVHYADLSILENDDVVQVFSQLKEQGKIRAMGVSVYEPAETKKAIDTGHWNVIQLPFNLMDQRQSAYFGEAASKGVGLVVRSALMRGFLSDRSTNLHPALRSVEEHIKGFNKLLGADFQDLAELATKFTLSFPEVSAGLIGIDKQAYLENALQTVNGYYLREEQLKKAQAMGYPDQGFLNLAEWDKNGWLS